MELKNFIISGLNKNGTKEKVVELISQDQELAKISALKKGIREPMNIYLNQINIDNSPENLEIMRLRKKVRSNKLEKNVSIFLLSVFAFLILLIIIGIIGSNPNATSKATKTNNINNQIKTEIKSDYKSCDEELMVTVSDLIIEKDSDKIVNKLQYLIGKNDKLMDKYIKYSTNDEVNKDIKDSCVEMKNALLYINKSVYEPTLLYWRDSKGLPIYNDQYTELKTTGYYLINSVLDSIK